MTQDEDRLNTRVLAATKKNFMKMISYEDAGPFDDPDPHGVAPCFYKAFIFNCSIVPLYASNGYLSGGIPLPAMKRESWRRQFFCDNAYLRFGRVRTIYVFLVGLLLLLMLFKTFFSPLSHFRIIFVLIFPSIVPKGI